MNQATQQYAAVWPATYPPGATDSLVSNEVIVIGLSARAAWVQLDDTVHWPTYCSNVTDIRFHDNPGPLPGMDTRSRFTTFGSPIEAQITKYVPLVDGQAARVAWHSWAEGDVIIHLDVIYVWLLRDLSNGHIRILTQESQTGVSTQELVRTSSNPMINGHQGWITGLTRAVRDA